MLDAFDDLKTASALHFRIGDCIVSPQLRRVTVAGQDVRLGGRAFDLLVALLERRERIVPSSELYDLIWPGIAIEPNNLQVQIWALRRLLGRQAVATVPRRGYRLTAEVEVLTDLAVPWGTALPGCPPSGTPPAPPTDSSARSAGHLEAILRQQRTATLVGGNPAQRASIALAVAARLAPLLPLGAWRLGWDAVPVAQTERRVDELLTYVGRQAALMIFEECAAAAEASHQALQRALDAAPRARVLLTSTAPLCLRGERVVTLDDAGPPGPPTDMAPTGTGLRWASRVR